MTDLAELGERWAKLGRGELIPPPPLVSADARRYYKPFADAADEYVRWAQSPHERIYTGISEIDAEMRGLAPGELGMIIGYSHSGKTLVLNEILRTNRERYVAYFCPDEPRTLTLIKLTCLLHGMDPIVLERSVAADEQNAIDLLRETAEAFFPHLAVFEESVTLTDMERALSELSDVWGRKPDLVVLDYLELLEGGGEDVPSKANAVKAWGRRHDVPLLVLHQTSRTSGANGRTLTISSSAYGGEQQATHIIGVRRRIFEIEAEIRELEERLPTAKDSSRMMDRLTELHWLKNLHSDTLTINLVKNKRPGGKLVADIDYQIEKGTGRLWRMTNDWTGSN